MCLAGEFTVRRFGLVAPAAEIGSRKARQLLKLLAAQRPAHLSVDRIALALWGDDPPRQTADNVATLVSRLRAVLGPDVISRDR